MAEKSQFQMERSTTIDAPAATIYAHLVDFRSWRTWSPWEDVDPDLRRTYSDVTSGVGATYAWAGNRKAGAGTMRIVEDTAPSHLVVELTFLKPFKATNVVEFTLTPVAGGTTVVWLMRGDKTIGTRIMGLVGGLDKLVGKDFEEGLARLKTASETTA